MNISDLRIPKRLSLGALGFLAVMFVGWLIAATCYEFYWLKIQSRLSPDHFNPRYLLELSGMMVPNILFVFILGELAKIRNAIFYIAISSTIPFVFLWFTHLGSAHPVGILNLQFVGLFLTGPAAGLVYWLVAIWFPVFWSKPLE